ncbi:24689_t:CDS:2, partial [Dentiscutata erythropus]
MRGHLSSSLKRKPVQNGSSLPQCNWAHTHVLKEDAYGYYNRLEFNYCIDSAVRSTAHFPDGSVYKKKSELFPVPW